MFKVQSGWGMTVADSAKAALLASKDYRFEAATKWHTYVATNVPRRIWTLEVVVDTEKYLDDEILARTRMKPTRVTLSKFTDPTAATRTWVMSLPGEAPRPFTLFDSDTARKVMNNPRITQCTNCWGLHGPKTCPKPTTCRMRGNLAMNCRCAKDPRAQCVNCRGPHPADGLTCPARPRSQGTSWSGRPKNNNVPFAP